MKVIVAGYIDFEHPNEVSEILISARPHIEGALEEEGCIAYSWTECHLTPGRVFVYEEWTSSETLSAHLASHWYRDMGGRPCLGTNDLLGGRTASQMMSILHTQRRDQV